MSSIAIENQEDAKNFSKRFLRQGRSSVVVKMLFSYRRNIVLAAFFLPLIIGAFLALFGWIVATLGHYPLYSLGAFFANNSFHPIIIGLFFVITSFIVVSKNSSLILGMGFSKKDFWIGFFRHAAWLALITTSVYGVFTVIEFFTSGYSVGWNIVSSASPLLTMVKYSPSYHVLITIYYLFTLWILCLAAQLIGAVLSCVQIKTGILITSCVALLLGGLLIFDSYQVANGISYDLGLNLLFQPYDLTDGEVSYFDGPLQTRELIKAGSWDIILPDSMTMISIFFKQIVFSAMQLALLCGAGYWLLRNTDLR